MAKYILNISNHCKNSVYGIFGSSSETFILKYIKVGTNVMSVVNVGHILNYLLQLDCLTIFYFILFALMQHYVIAGKDFFFLMENSVK